MFIKGVLTMSGRIVKMKDLFHIIGAMVFLLSMSVHAFSMHDLALKKLTENLRADGAANGAVIAAKSKANPNYYYHWVRDAALAYDALLTVYPRATSAQKAWINKQFGYYRDFSAMIQRVPTQTGLGEPKFNIDGSSFNEPWGRPQNDGPALRALSLIHWADILMAEGKRSFILEKLYTPDLPAQSPIKMDLEYISHHWRDASFDLWEEVKGSHFYTLMVTRRALLDGADLAEQLSDRGAASWYRAQAKAIEQELQLFLDQANHRIKPTKQQVGGLPGKSSDLDIAVILGLLHGDRQDGFLSWDHPLVLSTMQQLTQAFKSLYPINQRNDIKGVAIGRYPEDHYSGGASREGNPWVLCTYAMAEAYYRMANRYDALGQASTALAMRSIANTFVERVRYHMPQDGSLSEQMNKYTGYMTSAYDLTWNYGAYLTLEASAKSGAVILPY